MERRSLIKFGKNSFVISLPREWVDANKLVKGSEIWVDQKSGSLTVMAQRVSEQERTVRVHCDGKQSSELENEITSCYKAGYSTIVVEGKELPQHAALVKRFVHHLTGMDVIDQSLNRIVVKDLIDVKQIALPTLLRRMDMMIRSMFDDALSEEMIEGDVLRERDLEINRLQFLVARVTRKVLDNPSLGNTLQVGILDAYTIDKVAWTLERIGDYVKRANSEMSGCADEESIKGILRDVQHLYTTTMKIYYNRDKAEAVIHHEHVLEKLADVSKVSIPNSSERCELLALEHIKNLLRDLRVILRATVESEHL